MIRGAGGGRFNLGCCDGGQARGSFGRRAEGDKRVLTNWKGPPEVPANYKFGRTLDSAGGGARVNPLRAAGQKFRQFAREGDRFWVLNGPRARRGEGYYAVLLNLLGKDGVRGNARIPKKMLGMVKGRVLCESRGYGFLYPTRRSQEPVLAFLGISWRWASAS